MNKLRFLISAIVIYAAAHNAQAQNKLAYIIQVDNAHNLYKLKQYKASALNYTSALSTNAKYVRSEDVYNAACSWALAGNRDSSFLYLTKLVKKYDFHYIGSLSKDNDLNSLRQDLRWQYIISTATHNKQKADEKLNRALMKSLDTIYNADQVSRRKIDSVEKANGMRSIQLKRLWDTINYNDSINVMKVERIIKKHGWPGIDIIGEVGNKTVWLVIQHATLDKQLKYLPLLRKSVQSSKSPAWYLAQMEDRILMSQGKKQVYGSQYEFDEKTQKYKLYPIVDERSVNDRRKLVGLPPLEQEAKTMGVDYTLPK